MRSTSTTALSMLLALNLAHSQGPAGALQEPVRVSGGIMNGLILTKPKVMPVIPPEALEKHVSGAVVLHLIIGKDGLVKDVSVISGPQLLRAPSIETVRQWTYRPYLLNGEAVEVDTTVTLYHQLGRTTLP